jgi:protein O-GlcNAc transferase
MSNASAERLLDQAGRQISAGDFAAAGIAVDGALNLDPLNVRGLCFGAIVAAETGQKEKALTTIQQALQLAPNVPPVVNNAACIFFQFGELAQAMEMWQWLDKTMPPSADVAYNLALCHMRLEDPDNAEIFFRKVVQLTPDHPDVYINLGNLAKSGGRIEESIAIFREGVRRHPNDVRSHSNLLYALHFDLEFGPEDILRQTAAWGRAFEAAIPAIEHHTNDRSPDRRLRIGYLSPNMREHSETYFVLPLFRTIDRSAYQTYVYSCNTVDDEMTPLLREHADVWRDVVAWNDQQLVEIIQQDRIDVLVDLSMHMHGGRLVVFARKAAPVQMAWPAYPSTTGLTRMDYTVLDPYLYTQDPSHFTESPYILPACYWCYEPYGPRPEVSALPSRAGTGLTFGCLNHFGKVNRPTLDAWIQILQRVQDSRLLLHVESKNAADDVRTLFSKNGITPKRLIFQGRVKRDVYLRSYHFIDIALDPFPYNGATTTCDALWMGVPVVSRSGATAVSRAGLTILSNLGLPELVAQTWDEYISIAVNLASDQPRLQELRQSLRGRMERSVVMDTKTFAVAMGQAYRWMWQRWCAMTK